MKDPKRKKKEALPCGRPLPAQSRAISPSRVRAKLEKYLKNHDLKHSEAREKILNLLFQNSGKQLEHFGIQDLLKCVKKAHPEVGPATVYRNFTLFVESEVIRETLTTETGEKLFELALDQHHDHIVCVNCNQVFEFHEKVIENAQDKLGKKLKFNPVKHKHIIYASCAYDKVH